MLYQRINRSDPEKIFIVAKNTYSTATLTNGQPVCWDYATDADGIGVTKPYAFATSGGASFAGVAAESIAANAYGLIQTYGYHSSVAVRTTTASSDSTAIGRTAVAAGVPLTLPLAAEFCLEGVKTGSACFLKAGIGGFALAAQASYTTKRIAVFIKAM